MTVDHLSGRGSLNEAGNTRERMSNIVALLPHFRLRLRRASGRGITEP